MIYLKHLEDPDWDRIDSAEAERQNRRYRKQLFRLRPRLSPRAFQYFWLGFAETGIHDAHLISLAVGDGLSRLPRRLQHDPIRIKAEFLNQNDRARFVFTYSAIKRFSFDFDATRGIYLMDLATGKYFRDADWFLKRNRLDHVLGDELTASDKKYLHHEFCFASGARIVVEAAKITFHRQRVRP